MDSARNALITFTLMKVAEFVRTESVTLKGKYIKMTNALSANNIFMLTLLSVFKSNAITLDKFYNHQANALLVMLFRELASLKENVFSMSVNIPPKS